jgi:hypothetical protein
MTLSQLKAIIFAPDKVLHAKASAAVLVGNAVMIYIGYMLGLHPLTIMCLVGAWTAAAAVEGTQWWDNRGAKARGEPPPHDVSFLDAVASAFLPTVAAIAFEVARFFGQLPVWASTFSTDRIPPWLSI